MYKINIIYTMLKIKKSKRGFASMGLKKRKQIASLGGKMAHKYGKAHKWNSKEAAMAGRKSSRKKK
ncbi:MAG: hypothetical protein ACYDBX_01655 [Patescibacteria group bacterium]